jgi:GT2 family glycosyltransferase
LFGEEVDLCLRAQRAGWKVRLCAEAVFEHVGGAAMRADWPAMYREQLRGHLRLLAKHEGTRDAERARAFLRLALRARALLAWGERRALYRDASSWLASGEVASLLASPGRTTPGRSAGAEDRTTRGAG